MKAAAERLKVFPLPSVVLLPGGLMPLHIFEPRYQAMLKDAIATDGVFAMAQVTPGQEHLLSGRPGLDPMLCAGVVSVHEHLEDGRSNLVLTGICRMRLESEWPQTKPYREVRAEPLPDQPYEGPEEGELRATVFDLMARVPQESGQRLAQVITGKHGGALADAIISSLVSDPERRFEVLNQLDVPSRLADVKNDLLELIAQLKPLKRPEGPLN